MRASCVDGNERRGDNASKVATFANAGSTCEGLPTRVRIVVRHALARRFEVLRDVLGSADSLND